MPYRNPRNIGVAQQMSDINQTHINREQQINDFSTTSEVPSQLESMVMRRPEVHGGSGYAAATNKDLGFEPTLGATGGVDAMAAKRRVRKKAIEVGEGLSAAGVSTGAAPPAGSSNAEGISGGAKPARTRKKKGEGQTGGALLSLRNLDTMKGQPPDTIQAKETITASGISGGASVPIGSGGSKGGRSKRTELVKEVMKKHGLSLPQASKFVKEHNLY